ncbi:MAG: DUF305 domain-containing protein [Candidatus Sericytochromatia bacterium]|nr:DUF305 domain-containing protein [Candidatus Sericytochromatia bacterium]
MKKAILGLTVLLITSNYSIVNGYGKNLENNSYQIAYTKDKSMMESMTKNMDKMKSMKMSGHVDQDFGSMMMIHHKGAIDMANMEIHSGKEPSLKKMAQDIIKKQKKEIKDLDSMVSKLKISNKSNTTHNKDFEKMMMDTMKMPMDMMSMDEHADHNFVSMMMMHHQEGVAMAKLELKHGMDATMKKMAQNIINDQEKEIKIFQNWMDKHK